MNKHRCYTTKCYGSRDKDGPRRWAAGSHSSWAQGNGPSRAARGKGQCGQRQAEAHLGLLSIGAERQPGNLCPMRWEDCGRTGGVRPQWVLHIFCLEHSAFLVPWLALPLISRKTPPAPGSRPSFGFPLPRCFPHSGSDHSGRHCLGTGLYPPLDRPGAVSGILVSLALLVTGLTQDRF